MAKILIADDDDTIRTVLRSVLTRAGHMVICSSNGAIAWQMVQDNPDIDLLISDVVMPEMDGKELVRRIRSTPETYKFPIMMISGFVPFKDIRGILEMGVSKFLPKPFTNDQLMEDVVSCLS